MLLFCSGQNCCPLESIYHFTRVLIVYEGVAKQIFWGILSFIFQCCTWSFQGWGENARESVDLTNCAVKIVLQRVVFVFVTKILCSLDADESKSKSRRPCFVLLLFYSQAVNLIRPNIKLQILITGSHTFHTVRMKSSLFTLTTSFRYYQLPLLCAVATRRNSMLITIPLVLTKPNPNKVNRVWTSIYMQLLLRSVHWQTDGVS